MKQIEFNEKGSNLNGHWKLEVFNGDDHTKENLLEVIEGDNVVTTNGKGLLLDRLFTVAGFGGAINSMGIGNSATGALAADTQLQGSAPVPTLQALDAVPTRAGLVVTCVSTFGTAVANQVWQELALFNGTTNGTSVMFNRIAPIGPFTKTASVSIVVTVTITQS